MTTHMKQFRPGKTLRKRACSCLDNILVEGRVNVLSCSQSWRSNDQPFEPMFDSVVSLQVVFLKPFFIDT